MANEPIARTERASDKELLLFHHVHQGGASPYAYATFVPANKVDAAEGDSSPGIADPDGTGRTLRANDQAGVWYEERDDIGRYTLWLQGSVGGSAALQQMAAMETDVASRMAAGDAPHAASANAWYAVLAQCAALNSTAAILTQLGIEVRGANPFPA